MKIDVVLCKDCVWYENSHYKKDYTIDKRYAADYCTLYGRLRKKDYFCADGERKDGAE